MKIALFLLGLSTLALAQRQQQQRGSRDETTTPVPILRQINTVNEDGSYTYGYEGGDGSYKIENKAKNGEVSGKYGYYDDQGSLREIEYGASKLGFNPSGTGIRSPVLPDHVQGLRGQDYNDGDDGTYDAARYERPYDHLNAPLPSQQQNQLGFQAQPQQRRTRPRGQRRLNVAPQQQQPQQQYYQPQPQQQQYQQPQPQQYQQPQQQQYQQPQQQQYQQPQPQYQQQQQYQAPQHTQQRHHVAGNSFHGHPARNIDINSGSFSLNY